MDVGVLMMEPLTSAAQWRERVRRIDELGVTTLQVSDHFDRSPASPLVALATAATHSSRLRLGTLVLNNDFHHPAVLAKEIASLQTLCGGRLEVGIGAGWMDADYAVSGIVRETPGRRIDRLAATVRILRAVLAAGADPADVVAGEHRLAGFRNVPPVECAPPLLIGGGGRRVLELAAQQADIVGVNFTLGEGRVGRAATRSASTAATAEKIARVRTAAGERIPLLHLVVYWAEVTERPEEAAARRISAQGLELEPRDLLASPHCLIGPAGAVAERLAELRELGFGYLTVYEADVESLAPVLLGAPAES